MVQVHFFTSSLTVPWISVSGRHGTVDLVFAVFLTKMYVSSSPNNTQSSLRIVLEAQSNEGISLGFLACSLLWLILSVMLSGREQGICTSDSTGRFQQLLSRRVHCDDGLFQTKPPFFRALFFCFVCLCLGSQAVLSTAERVSLK